MKSQKRPRRPKKWTMRVVSFAAFLEDDRIERLLDFRQEYRARLKQGRIHADSFARAHAIRSMLYASREALIGLLILGKKLILG